MAVIQVDRHSDGFHLIESQSDRTENWMGDGYIEVPQELVPNLNGGWCDLTIEDGVLTAVTPTERPKHEMPQDPTDTDVLNTLLGVK